MKKRSGYVDQPNPNKLFEILPGNRNKANRTKTELTRNLRAVAAMGWRPEAKTCEPYFEKVPNIRKLFNIIRERLRLENPTWDEARIYSTAFIELLNDPKFHEGHGKS